MERDDDDIKEKLQDLQKQLEKKQMFKEAVSSLRSLLRGYYPSASPCLRKSFYSVVCRVATILRTRYSKPGFWNAGLGLFREAEHLMCESSERDHLQSCIAQAQEQLIELENLNGSGSSPTRTSGGYLFDGHLTVDPEPPLPDWLVLSNYVESLYALFPAEFSRAKMESNNTTEDAADLLIGRLNKILQDKHNWLEEDEEEMNGAANAISGAEYMYI